MRHYSKSHGSHCYLRSFKTSCPRCGADVLYWECTHGSKIFFQYPPYGKLQKHFCRMSKLNINKKKVFPVIIKSPKGLLEDPFITCPVCGKIFKDEDSLKNHLNEMKKQDFEHNIFFRNELVFEYDLKKVRYSQFEDNKYQKNLKFGKINIRKEKKG
jgi:uncharacterized C2H2 Zn-finger protein